MDISVNFMHPTDGKVINVTLDDSMTGQEVIGELIANDFVPMSNQGYNLAIMGGVELKISKTFSENGVKNNDTIRVIPATDAGGYFSPADSIPGFEKAPKEKYNFSKLIESPQSVQMIVHLYQDALEENKTLYEKIEDKNILLEQERLKSNNRLTASLLLIISQIVIGIGCSIIISHKEIGTWVIIAGFLQSLLAIFLNFYKRKI